jgi:1-deoxy-D-xylulose-5-phosphate synthase
LVGADGPTHNGSYDLSYLRCIPNMVVMTPSDENECRQMLYTAYQLDAPAAVRYPRGGGPGAPVQTEMQQLPIGKGVVRRQGKKVAILSFGSLLGQALEAAEVLDATVADMRFVKPLDEALVKELAATHDLLVTLEENVVQGGAGSAVLEALQHQHLATPVLQLGLPDTFIEHGAQAEQLTVVHLDAAGVLAAIRQRMSE